LCKHLSNSFTALATSLQELRDGADAPLSLVHERTRDRYIAEAAAGNVGKVEGLCSRSLPEILRLGQFRPAPLSQGGAV